MELILLKTAIVNKLRFLVNKLESMSKSYLWIMVLMTLFGFISLITTVRLKNRQLRVRFSDFGKSIMSKGEKVNKAYPFKYHFSKHP